MTKVFEVASYGNPENNDGVPSLLDFVDGPVAEEDVEAAVTRFLSASPCEVGEHAAARADEARDGKFYTYVWGVSVRQIGEDGMSYAEDTRRWVHPS